MAEFTSSGFHVLVVLGLTSSMAVMLSGCESPDGANDVSNKEEDGIYAHYEGLNCFSGHGAALQEYLLQNISIDDCLTVCSNQTQCEGVVIVRSADQHAQGKCWLHTKLDLQACVQSRDHDLWLRKSRSGGDQNLDVPSINYTDPGFLKVLDGHNCWTPCGGKSGYCAACGSRTNVWRACCRAGQTDPVCDRVDNSLKAVDQHECVDVPNEEFPNGVPWMRSFDVSYDVDMPEMAIGVGDATFKSTSPNLCNRLSIDRIGIAVMEPDIHLEGTHLGLHCGFTGVISAVNGTIMSPVSITTAVKQHSSISAKLQMPASAHENASLSIATCMTDLHFDVEIQQTHGEQQIPDDVKFQAEELIINLTTRMLHDFGCAQLSDQLGMIVPQLEEHASSHRGELPVDTNSGADSDDCYRICGSKSGWCPSCGAGRACCRSGFDTDVLACAMAVSSPSDSHHECVESAAEEPWLQSLAFRPDDIEVDFEWGLKAALRNVVCGGGSLRNLLVDVHASGFSVHLTGLDFEVICSATLDMNGVTASIRAGLVPGVHGRMLVDTPVDQVGQIGHADVSDCRVDIPWQIQVYGHWAAWLLNGLVSALQRAFRHKINTAICDAVKRSGAITETLDTILKNSLKSHEFKGR